MKFFLICLLATAFALENGLARTPPMVYIDLFYVYRAGCLGRDCVKHPDSCINERLIIEHIDRIAEDGYLEAGYNYVNIDDCWESYERDENGNLQANSTRFPHGMLWLAEYAESKGVLLGTYTDFGYRTCGGYPGTLGHIDEDIKTFADWRMNNLKVDGCWAETAIFKDGYTNISNAFKKAGRDMVYACSWPAYDNTVDFRYLSKICNLWRPYADIYHSWWSLSDIIRQWGDQQARYAPANAPGHWVDPDMLVTGNAGEGLGYEEYKTQMSLWAIFAAPLYMGNDLRNITNEEKEIILNRDIIEVDQDPFGVAGRMYFRNEIYEVWARPLDNGDWAAAIYNKDNNNQTLTFDPHYIGLRIPNQITLRDLWLHKDVVSLKQGEKWEVVKPHETKIWRIRFE